MTTAFLQTLTPTLIIFSRLPRREIIRPYDARRRWPPSATKRGIVRLWLKVAVQVVLEDVRARAGGG